MSKVETDRRTEEIFLRGLEPYTDMELYKAGIHNKTLREIILHLERIESGLLVHSERSKKMMLPQKTPQTKAPLSSTKWCTHHRNNTHNSKDCYFLNNNKGIKEKENKTMILREENEHEPLELILEGTTQGNNINLLIDSESHRNYVRSDVIKSLDLSVEDCKPLRTTFGDGTHRIISKQALINVTLPNRKNYHINFKILDNAPIEFLLGNEFLTSYNAILNYKDRTIVLDNDIVVLKNARKNIDEILEDRLMDNICSVVQEDEIIKYLKFYQQNNNNFSHINNLKVEFKIIKEPKNMKPKNYSVPFKFLERAKDEVNRLLKENIIEKSESHITSPAFFKEKKKTNELRLVVDYREINKYIGDDIWNIPNIEDSITLMGEIYILVKLI
ncbi:reverse transcriptase [Vairimorpha necatrix]|uniref:Reverse transcriptase n=1 Tax=Vairimorpha necatrix TaxID=6039 RepID=A0AAX4JF32_9MICR